MVVMSAEMDVCSLTDQQLLKELRSLGANVGPIVASTRAVYQRKLQTLIKEGTGEEHAAAKAKPVVPRRKHGEGRRRLDENSDEDNEDYEMEQDEGGVEGNSFINVDEATDESFGDGRQGGDVEESMEFEPDSPSLEQAFSGDDTAEYTHQEDLQGSYLSTVPQPRITSTYTSSFRTSVPTSAGVGVGETRYSSVEGGDTRYRAATHASTTFSSSQTTYRPSDPVRSHRPSDPNFNESMSGRLQDIRQDILKSRDREHLTYLKKMESELDKRIKGKKTRARWVPRWLIIAVLVGIVLFITLVIYNMDSNQSYPEVK